MNESKPNSLGTNSGRHGFTVGRRELTLVTVLIVSGLVVWSYAATHLNVSNVATIQTGGSLSATGEVTADTVCSATTGDYTDSPAVDWRNVPSGSKQSKFICLENNGTGNSQVGVTSDLPSIYGSINSPQVGQTILVSSFLLVEIDWDVSPEAPLGGVSFTITFQ